MILGLIPARGGSKGIPKKNIKNIAGRPLIAWTIEAAKKSKLLDKFVVSTEDANIAEVAIQHHCGVIKRPPELAADEADTIDVMKHAVRSVPCDVLVLLQPTSPVRRSGLIDECIKEFMKGGYDSLATGFMCKYTEYGKENLRRQDIKGFFHDDGNIYIIKSALINNGDRYGNKIARKCISRFENIDIDDDFDFWMAEKILGEHKI